MALAARYFRTYEAARAMFSEWTTMESWNTVNSTATLCPAFVPGLLPYCHCERLDMLLL